MHGPKDQLTEDIHVVQSVLAGDLRQLNELARRFTAFIERTLVGRGAKPADAEDVVARLWNDCLPNPQSGRSLLEKYRGTLPLRSWLLTVATRRLIDHHRQQRHLVESGLANVAGELHDRPAPEPSPAGEHDLAVLLRQCLRSALQSCSPQELLILRLVHLHGLTQREVSGLWAIHESRISRLLQQALRRIQRHTLRCVRNQDPWLEWSWEDFITLCEAESVL